MRYLSFLFIVCLFATPAAAQIGGPTIFHGGVAQPGLNPRLPDLVKCDSLLGGVHCHLDTCSYSECGSTCHFFSDFQSDDPDISGFVQYHGTCKPNPNDPSAPCDCKVDSD